MATWALIKFLEREVRPAAVIHCHKIALAFVGIGHFIIEETQVDLCKVREKPKVERKTETDKGSEVHVFMELLVILSQTVVLLIILLDYWFSGDCCWTLAMMQLHCLVQGHLDMWPRSSSSFYPSRDMQPNILYPVCSILQRLLKCDS